MTTILVADDVAVIREPIAAALRKAGHTTLCATNGLEVLNLARSEHPDLLILDIQMPDLSGMDALARLRKDAAFRDTPVILLTDSSERDVVLRARDLGVRHYCIKSSFSMRDLQRRIHLLLAQRGLESTTSATPQTPEADPAPATHVLSPRQCVADGSAVSADAAMSRLKELKPLLTRSQLMERIESYGEPRGLSPVVSEVLKLTRSPGASIEHIAKVIRRDQAIALKVLRLANSAAYSRGGPPVESVGKAVVHVGIKAIGQAVLGIGVVDAFSAGADDPPVDPRLFWEHSIACGLIASQLAAQIRCAEPETAFTMGLIHDVGRMITLDILDEEYREVLRVASELQLPVEQVEARLLLNNHADGMDRILHQWGFPRDLVDPVVFHHLSVGNIRAITPKRVPETAMLALANRLANAMLIGSSGNPSIYPTVEFCHALKVSPAWIESIEAGIVDATDDLKFAMLASSGGGDWPDVLTDLRSRFPVSMRPLFVSVHPELDALRLACAKLTDPARETPNIAVVHLTDARERTQLADKLRIAEQEAGVQDLPAIFVSPSGKTRLNDRAIENRATESLPLPLRLERLLQTAGRLLPETAIAAAA